MASADGEVNAKGQPSEEPATFNRDKVYEPGSSAAAVRPPACPLHSLSIASALLWPQCLEPPEGVAWGPERKEETERHVIRDATT
ncbi:hypothetical protein HPB50_000931 [Hyalomma asiaticum]|uniref:Uncharacterized protein n=1 Tax=Hyalomma asiaticum TaxID=266040 RepID=A0ACB7RMI0_HYAAI|nr:hypothetical protein HPB50_000931 [Hyalomma asiaticum]